MKLRIFFILFTAFFALNISSQTEIAVDKQADKHEHHRNEIGIANSQVYFMKEKIFAYGFTFHYIRNFPETKFGIGIGYERIFDEHKHNTFGFVGTYSPFEKLSFNILPGLSFEDKNKNLRFALNLETVYEWKIQNFHIGPALEIALDAEDYHISLGLHISYGF